MALNNAPGRVWSSKERDAFIACALSSDAKRGMQGNYGYRILPKMQGAGAHNDDNDRKSKATRAIMHTIFSKPEYRIIAMKVYDLLWARINAHPFVRGFINRDVIVVMKGGTSYTYVVGQEDADVFPFSDLDIVIIINPNLPEALFNGIKSTLNTLVLQTISQYKRMLDHMLFLNKDMDYPMLPSDVVERFKDDLNDALTAMDDDEGMFVSPCTDMTARNMVSRNSCIFANSTTQEENIVRVEVPHYENCERIPLRKTPIYCSHNRSISFDRTPSGDERHEGCFDLYRMRWNVMFRRDGPVSTDGEEAVSDGDGSGGSDNSGEGNNHFRRPYEFVTADFVDISILGQNDAELKDFWNHGQVMNVLDRAVGMWVMIPDLATMMHDLHKMLHLYECPENKRARRQERYDRLRTYIAGI